VPRINSVRDPSSRFDRFDDGQYIDHTVTAAFLITILRRGLVLVLLTAVALAPAIARAHLRISARPNPAQENARFRWSNSCEQALSRDANSHVAPLVVGLSAATSDASPRWDVRPEANVVPPVSLDRLPRSLRAPPRRIL
jgi:hypothetical protein